MSAPAIIQDLVNRFRDSRELYRSGRYNEAQLRQEFLNPLFETLGWDMYNRSNFAPQYREVIHEDSLEDQGSLKAPDYAFRIGTSRKFFVEAKNRRSTSVTTSTQLTNCAVTPGTPICRSRS